MTEDEITALLDKAWQDAFQEAWESGSTYENSCNAGNIAYDAQVKALKKQGVEINE